MMRQATVEETREMSLELITSMVNVSYNPGFRSSSGGFNLTRSSRNWVSGYWNST